MIPSVVQYQHHAPPGCLLAQQALEKALERDGIENRAHHANELTALQADGTEAGDGLAGRRVLQDWILDFRRYPHAATRPVLLEVTFIQTPQFDVGTASQATEFFLLPRLSADPIEQLGGAACVTGSPVVEIVAGIAAPQGPPRSGAANVPTSHMQPLRGQLPESDPLRSIVTGGYRASILSSGICNLEPGAGRREFAQQMAARESPRTTALYDRRDDEVAVDEVEKISIKNCRADSPGFAKSCFMASPLTGLIKDH